MKKGYNKIIACILILMIFSLPIIFFTNPKKEFSENENTLKIMVSTEIIERDSTKEISKIFS